MATVEVAGLRQSFDGREVLSLDSLRLQRGERLLVQGASGCGKTTLVHLLAGLQRPAAGSVSVVGTALEGLRPAALDRFRGRHIGIVFQRLHLLSSLTALGNVLAAQHLAGLPQDADRCRRLLDELGVGHRADARPETLSRGEAQRVALARAIVNEPVLLLADEPTASLDDEACETVAALLAASARDAALVVATHDARITGHFDRHLALAVAAA